MIDYLSKARLIKRLQAKTKYINGHWLWIGRLSTSKYGVLWCGKHYTGHHIATHRLSAYIYLDLDLNSDLQANHKIECTFKNCWNPEHLYVGTEAENGVDYRESREQCKKGHDLKIHGYLVRRHRLDPNLRLKCRICETASKRRSYHKIKNQNLSVNQVDGENLK